MARLSTLLYCLEQMFAGALMFSSAPVCAVPVFALPCRSRNNCRHCRVARSCGQVRRYKALIGGPNLP
jgi:hypothetical protein